MSKYSGPRLTLPIAKMRVHKIDKQLIGFRVHCTLLNSSGDTIPIMIDIPTDTADVRPDDLLTLYTEVATRAHS